MPTLIETPGASNANTYATLAEANAYFASHLYGATWNEATAEDKEKSLIMATRLLDTSFDWTGKASSETQALAWPRIGMTSRNGYPIPSDVIPVDLKYAEIEYAQGMMVANLAAGNDIVAQGIAAVKAGPVEIKFKDTIETKTVPDSVTNFLPDSWYTTDGEEAGRTDMVFEVL